VKAGTPLPIRVETLTPARLVVYAGATWDWHALHYDAAFASEVGLAGPIADGQLYGALFSSQVLDLLGPKAQIETLSFRFHSMVFAGETVEATGDVTATEDDGGLMRVTASHRLSVGDRLGSTGTSVATVPI
jgi:acyl dehydratase